jgi:oxaloacetate decarboxylase alpha subunit
MVGVLDETLRVAPQSHWATRMKTQWMLEIAPLINSSGYERVCVGAGVTFETAVKFLQEDPWERLRLLGMAMPDVCMDVLMRSRNLFGWERYPDEIVALLFKCLKDAGVNWIKIFDGLNDYSNISAHFKIAKELDLKTSGLMAYSLSPVHTNEYFGQKAIELVKLGADAVMLADASGLLTPTETEKIVKHIRNSVPDGFQIEFYAHDCTGLANEVNAAAIRAGADIVITSSDPLAYGDSTASVSDLYDWANENCTDLGLNLGEVKKANDLLYWIAFREQKPIGTRVTFDPIKFSKYTSHQIPGGMMSNFRRQLDDLGLVDRMDEFLEETGRVREEMGYPIMVTPFSQFVGVQATFNVMQDERYQTVPKELARYIMGYYGKSPGPIDENVLDKVAEQTNTTPQNPKDVFGRKILKKVRRDLGADLSDEELLLRLFYGSPIVDAMLEERNNISELPSVKAPLQVLLEHLKKETDIKSFFVQKGDAKLSIERNVC